MFTLSRRQARSLRAVARKCVPKGAGRGPDPTVTFAGGRHGPFAFAAVGEVTAGFRLLGPIEPQEAVTVPVMALAACEGADPVPVHVEAVGRTVTFTWADRGQDRTETVSALTPKTDLVPPMPPPFADAGPAFLHALHEAGRLAAGEDTRYSLARLQVRGAAGQVVGSDGKQAGVFGGFRFPFPDDVLVPAVPVFGLKEVARAAPVRVARTPGGLCVAAGEWLVWLAADAYPDVAGVIKRNAGGSTLRLGPKDADRLLDVLAVMKPGDGDGAAGVVTLTLGPAPAAWAGRAGVPLADSVCAGPACRWAVTPAHLHRAVALGFRDFSAKRPDGTAVAARGPDAYLFVLLAPGPAEPSPPAAAVSAITTPNGVPMTRTPDPDRRPGGPPDDEAPDLLAEVDALRAVLGDALTRAGRLGGLLKHYRRHRKALETAWASLQQLKLGQGG